MAASRAAAAAGEHCTELPGGRKRWRRERFFFIDPFGADLKNVVACVETVEVVQGASGG